MEHEAPAHRELFPSAWAKIARADRHRTELGETIDAWQQREPLASELETNDSAAIFRVRVREPLPPEVPCIVGDLVHNLRSALDHVVYACVDNPGEENCWFPNFKGGDAARFTRAQWDNKIRTAIPVRETSGSRATRLRKILRPLNPYIGGEHEFLWLLTYLDNVDKHRLVLALSAAVATTTTVSEMNITTNAQDWLAENAATKGHDFMEVPATESGEPLFKDAELHTTFQPAHQFPLEDGTEVFRWTGPGWSNIRDFGMKFDVVLGEPERYAGASLLENLDILGHNTASMISSFAIELSEESHPEARPHRDLGGLKPLGPAARPGGA